MVKFQWSRSSDLSSIASVHFRIKWPWNPWMDGSPYFSLRWMSYFRNVNWPKKWRFICFLILCTSFGLNADISKNLKDDNNWLCGLSRIETQKKGRSQVKTVVDATAFLRNLQSFLVEDMKIQDLNVIENINSCSHSTLWHFKDEKTRLHTVL